MGGATANVLIIEDDAVVREFYTAALESAGYRVCAAPNGLAALSQIDHDAPDLILLDLLMPVMAGWEFLSLYRERSGPHAPVIVCAATGMFEDSAIKAGATAFLPKPVDLDDLLTAVARHLPDRPTARRRRRPVGV